MRQIINSMLDTDFYKLTMGQFNWKLYQDIQVRYTLIDRGHAIFPPGFDRELRRQVDLMGRLQLTPHKEYPYLLTQDVLSRDYVDWYRDYRFDPSQVQITQSGGDLKVVIEGPWFETVYWEVPLMALVSELYNTMTGRQLHHGYQRTAIHTAKTLQEALLWWLEFGSRRRDSYEVQYQSLIAACDYRAIDGRPGLIGTSNVNFARILNLRPMGTMAHELFMVLAAYFGSEVVGSKQVLVAWKLLYEDKLSVVLPDTFTTDMFLRDVFTPDEARRWSAMRQDSGDPFAFVDKVLAYYAKIGIDPMSKTIIFSDSLNTDLAIQIGKYCAGKIPCQFGIGTFFSNNVGNTPLKIVIKVTEVLVDGVWVPAIKKSDDPAKSTGLANLKATVKA